MSSKEAITHARSAAEWVPSGATDGPTLAKSVGVIGDEDVCCLVAPDALTPEVRQLRDHLVASRDLLDALADPARQDLVQVLARTELNVGDIATRVTLSRPTVSHHLLVLKRAGLVRTRKQGREVFYRLNKAPIVNTLQGLVDSLTCC